MYRNFKIIIKWLANISHVFLLTSYIHFGFRLPVHVFRDIKSVTLIQKNENPGNYSTLLIL